MSKGTKLDSSKPCTNKPVLVFSELAWEKMWYLVKHNKVGSSYFECTSIGVMAKENPNLVLDIWVPEQENTPSHTEADDDDLMNWTRRMVGLGIDPSQLSLWMHSHGSMGVFWSTTDTDTIERLACEPVQWSIVCNKDGKWKARCDIFVPHRFWWDDCEVRVKRVGMPGIKEWFDETQKEKISNGVAYSGTVTRGSGAYTGHQGGLAEWEGYYHAGRASGLGVSRGGHPRVGGTTKPSVVSKPSVVLDIAELKRRSWAQETPKEVLHLSHPLLQAAYDSGLISEREAEVLDMSVLTSGVEDEDLIDTLTTFVRMGGDFSFGKPALPEDQALALLDSFVEEYEEAQALQALAGSEEPDVKLASEVAKGKKGKKGKNKQKATAAAKA